MEYSEMNIWKVNEFHFLDRKVDEFTSRWSQNMENLRRPSYLKKKAFE